MSFIPELATLCGKGFLGWFSWRWPILAGASLWACQDTCYLCTLRPFCFPVACPSLPLPLCLASSSTWPCYWGTNWWPIIWPGSHTIMTSSKLLLPWFYSSWIRKLLNCLVLIRNIPYVSSYTSGSSAPPLPTLWSYKRVNNSPLVWILPVYGVQVSICIDREKGIYKINPQWDRAIRRTREVLCLGPTQPLTAP